MSTKTYRTWVPEEMFLLPPSPMEWLPEGHLAYFILDVVLELDLGSIDAAVQSTDPRGTRPYDPRMMVALLLFAYCRGVYSSRRIERATYEDVGFRVIAAGQHPHFTTISDFRLAHRERLAALFTQVLLVCKRAGLTKLGLVALDGTKVKASASKHKAMSYQRMLQEEARLQAEMKALLQRAEAIDAEENAALGANEKPEDLPAELRRREQRLERIREAREALEAEAKAAHDARGYDESATTSSDAAPGDDEGDGSATTAPSSGPDPAKSGESSTAKSAQGKVSKKEPPKHRVPTTADGKPTPKAQRNFTDPESRMMLGNKEFVQGFNCQAVVNEAQVIVAVEVTNHPTDMTHLPIMVDAVYDNLGETPEVFLADSGYLSEENVTYCELAGVEPIIAPGRIHHSEQGPINADPENAAEENAPGADAAGLPVKQRMAAKLATAEGRTAYAKRKILPEPVFGQIKHARGFRRFSMRGLLAGRAEWSFVCTCHNLLKLFTGGARRLDGLLAPVV